MASQQALFGDTVAAMKKALKRKAYESDSDSDIESYTNRGHKLKRRARFARKGQLMPSAEPNAYKEVVEYAGARRSIIHQNPPLIDGDGYDIDSDDEDSQVEEALISAAELDPYANIRLEHVLAPLTASTDLPSHPLLSKPFTSQNLTELVSQSSQMMHKENRSLWKVRHLWTSLCGDAPWAPCEVMLGQNDIELYSDDLVARHQRSLLGEDVGREVTPLDPNGQMQTEGPETPRKYPETSTRLENLRDRNTSKDADVPMTNADSTDDRQPPLKHDGKSDTNNADNDEDGRADDHYTGEDTNMTNGNAIRDADRPTGPDDPEHSRRNHDNLKGRNEDTRMQLGPEPSTTNHLQHIITEDLLETFIHPMFLPPRGAQIDRNVDLPEKEAEDIRKLLALYVQKQEEVCRGAARLHEGLLKAERLRKDVLHWSKAEAHCGPNRDMSDGEDWYDKEEWGLTEDLKKGQDEEEEDTATTGKKTRNRR